MAVQELARQLKKAVSPNPLLHMDKTGPSAYVVKGKTPTVVFLKTCSVVLSFRVTHPSSDAGVSAISR
jgi:hypothetical protein